MLFFFKSEFYHVLNENQKNVLKIIGEKIKSHRLSKGISRTQLAIDLNTDEKHIRRIENGEVNPTLISLFKIFKSLELNFSTLDELSIENDFFKY